MKTTTACKVPARTSPELNQKILLADKIVGESGAAGIRFAKSAQSDFESLNPFRIPLGLVKVAGAFAALGVEAIAVQAELNLVKESQY